MGVIRLAVVLALATLSLAVNAADIPMAAPAEVGMSAEGLHAIDVLMQKHIDAGDIQGAVTVVARRGKVVHFEAYGFLDAENHIPMPKDAIFRMASSTKPVLGVAAMMMIEQGLLRADDPVSKYIPEFRHMQVAVLKEPADQDISPMTVPRGEVPPHRLVPAAREITIHDLLTHTSGLGSGGLGSAVADRPRRQPDDTLATVIPTYASMPLDFQPGSRWSYSAGTGLDVVARIVEIVSGTPFDVFLQQRIFEPLGMRDSYFNVPEAKQSRRVVIKGRNLAAGGGGGVTKYFSASGGLSSTAEDYLRFEQMLIHGGQLFGHSIISPVSVTAMSSNQVGDLYTGLYRNQQGVGFGYTVAVTLDEKIAGAVRREGAFGWGGAFGTRSWSDPKQELTAVLMLQQPHRETQAEFEQAVRGAVIETP
jgi:CubicO group peptidase (beta-lactamase class C family)